MSEREWNVSRANIVAGMRNAVETAQSAYAEGKPDAGDRWAHLGTRCSHTLAICERLEAILERLEKPQEVQIRGYGD